MHCAGLLHLGRAAINYQPTYRINTSGYASGANYAKWIGGALCIACAALAYYAGEYIKPGWGRGKAVLKLE